MIQDVLHTTGITATAGIGTNLYLCKIAMDIVAKHIPADKDGVRIAELDEMTYRRELWGHQPLTDFWRVGHGYASKLESMGLRTMGDIARLSEKSEDLLYRMFGINAELLIDHAWGWEPCTIAEIKAYKPESNSISSGQVLQEAYEFEKGRLVAREMTDLLALDLVEKHLITDQIVLTVGYDTVNLSDPARRQNYHDPVRIDHYGRQIPKEAHGSFNLPRYTASARILTESMEQLFNRCVNPDLLVRKITVVANHVINEDKASAVASNNQPDLFTDYEAIARQEAAETAELEKEKRLQLALLDIKKKLGKNAVLKGMNLLEGATAKERNEQIGGHKK